MSRNENNLLFVGVMSGLSPSQVEALTQPIGVTDNIAYAAPLAGGPPPARNGAPVPGQGERTGKEQKRRGEVSRRHLQVPNDDWPDKSTAVADGVDKRAPRRGAGAGQDRGRQRPEVPMAA